MVTFGNVFAFCYYPQVHNPYDIICTSAATVPDRRGDFDIPVEFKAPFKVMRRMVLACRQVYEAGGGEALEALKSRPVSFTAAALAEVLARWQRQGIPCAETRNPCKPSEAIARTMTRRWT